MYLDLEKAFLYKTIITGDTYQSPANNLIQDLKKENRYIEEYKSWIKALITFIAEFKNENKVDLGNKLNLYFCKNLKKQIGINETKSGGYKLKYKDKCKFSELWMLACKGSVIYFDDRNFNFAPCKFFSFHELDKFNMDHLLINALEDQSHLIASEKIDGSCIVIRYDTQLDDFNISTLATDREILMNGKESPTFQDMTMNLLKPELLEIIKQNQEISFIFELFSPYNRFYNIPIDTDFTSLNFLNMVYPDGLIYRNQELIQRLSEIDIPMPQRWDLGIIDTKDKLINRLEEILLELKSDPEKYGSKPEGLVVYVKDGELELPLIKYKDKSHLEKMRELKL